MTKQQILDHLKYFVLCISFSLLLTNCNNTDNEIVTEPKLENSKLTKGKLQDFEEVSTYVEQLQRNRANAMHAESDLENTNDFSIIYDQDMHIQQDAGFTTYSIPVLRETPVENTFSNLVIRFSDTYETEAFLINYTPVGSYMDDVAENELTPFTGEASIEAIVYDGSLDHLAENNNDCINITIKYCDWENNQHGAVHLAGENCTEGYMFYVTTFVCFGDDAPSLVDIPVPGDGSPNVSGYIYNSGTAGGSGTMHPPIVIPTVPKTPSYIDVDTLTDDMKEWLNRFENSEYKEAVDVFLIENGINEETKTIVFIAVELAMTDNLLNLESEAATNIMNSNLDCCGWGFDSGLSGVTWQYSQNIMDQSLMIMLDEYEPGHQFTKWEIFKIVLRAQKDYIHYLLDVGGLIPGGGIFFDATNAVIYTIEMDWTNAGFSLGAAIPLGGQWVTVAKWAQRSYTLSNGRKLVLRVYNLADGLVKFSSRGQLRKILGITDSSVHAHHIIPYGLWDNPLVQAAAKSNNVWHINDVYNGIPMPKNLHLSGHHAYKNAIEQKLISLADEIDINNVDEAYETLMNFCNYLKQAIQDNPHFTSGDFVNLINTYYIN